MKYFSFLLISLVLISCSTENSSSGINPLPNFDAMWDYSHPDSTEMRFKEILPLLTQTSEFSVTADYQAELLTQIARAQGLQGKFSEASNNLNKADSLITENMPVARIRFLLEKGRLLNTMNQKEEAVKLFLEAYEFGKNDSLDFYSLDAAHMLGFTTPLAEQMDWNLKALEIAEFSSDPRCENWQGALYNNIGWTYFDKKDYYHAYEMFKKGYEWRKTRNDPEATRIAKWAIARSLRSLFRFDEALHIQLTIEKELQDNKLPPDGYVYEELTELYFAKGDVAKIKEYAAKAYEILSEDEWLQKNEPERIRRLKDLSR